MNFIERSLFTFIYFSHLLSSSSLDCTSGFFVSDIGFGGDEMKWKRASAVLIGFTLGAEWDVG